MALYAAAAPNTAGGAAASAFKAADLNRDGVLTASEFQRWFQHVGAEQAAAAADVSEPPTSRQLFHVMLRNGVPFVGFGFLDNAGMIVCGEYIDDTLGAALKLSTMASAGIGNAISDVVGLSFGKVIENISIRLGLPDPMVRGSARADTRPALVCGEGGRAGGRTGGRAGGSGGQLGWAA